MSATPAVRSTGLFRKLLKVAGYLLLSAVLGIVALVGLGWWLQSRDDVARATAAPGEECRKVGEGNAQVTVCTRSDGGSTTTISAH